MTIDDLRLIAKLMDGIVQEVAYVRSGPFLRDGDWEAVLFSARHVMRSGEAMEALATRAVAASAQQEEECIIG